MATRDAASVASTDRPGERVNPAHESRKIEAQVEGQAEDINDPELRMADSEVIGVAVVPVAQRVVPAGLPADIGRLEVTAVSHRVADLDGDGNPDTLLTVREDEDGLFIRLPAEVAEQLDASPRARVNLTPVDGGFLLSSTKPDPVEEQRRHDLPLRRRRQVAR